jgi:hypothetical protein
MDVDEAVREAVAAAKAHVPPFESPDYWDGRYKATTESYEWLKPSSILDTDIAEALAAQDETSPRILHIGCGTSELSFNLRQYVHDPRQVHNVDFSPEAIEWGRKRERELFGFELDNDEDDEDGWVDDPKDGLPPQFEMPMSTWTLTSLLDLQSIISTCSLGAYNLVVDKTCCDNIACAPMSTIFLPYFLQIEGPPISAADVSQIIDEKYDIYPIHILAIHLALLTPPGARWVAFSFSAARFFFLEDKPMLSAGGIDKTLPKDVIDQGFPDSSKLWKIIRKECITTGIETKQLDPNDFDDPNKPSNCYWIFVMERTQVELKV